MKSFRTLYSRKIECLILPADTAAFITVFFNKVCEKMINPSPHMYRTSRALRVSVRMHRLYGKFNTVNLRWFPSNLYRNHLHEMRAAKEKSWLLYSLLRKSPITLVFLEVCAMLNLKDIKAQPYQPSLVPSSKLKYDGHCENLNLSTAIKNQTPAEEHEYRFIRAAPSGGLNIRLSLISSLAFA